MSEKIYINIFKDKFGGYSAGIKDEQGVWKNISLYTTNKKGETLKTADGTPYLSIGIDEGFLELYKKGQENRLGNRKETESPKKEKVANDEDVIDPNDLPF